MIRPRKRYLAFTILLLITEIAIALFINDSFIRPYLGDFLVVILIYCFIQSFFNVSILPAAIGCLLFAYSIEILQYLSIVKKLGLEHYRIAYVILGSSFEWTDILMYTLGILTVICVEKTRRFTPE
jgi:hypothetical protein